MECGCIGFTEQWCSIEGHTINCDFDCLLVQLLHSCFVCTRAHHLLTVPEWQCVKFPESFHILMQLFCRREEWGMKIVVLTWWMLQESGRSLQSPSKSCAHCYRSTNGTGPDRGNWEMGVVRSDEYHGLDFAVGVQWNVSRVLLAVFQVSGCTWLFNQIKLCSCKGMLDLMLHPFLL